MPDLPKWVWDVLIDLVEQQDTHPELLFTSGGFEGARKYDWCPCAALAKVPVEVRDQARAILRYKQQSEATDA